MLLYVNYYWYHCMKVLDYMKCILVCQACYVYYRLYSGRNIADAKIYLCPQSGIYVPPWDVYEWCFDLFLFNLMCELDLTCRIAYSTFSLGKFNTIIFSHKHMIKTCNIYMMPGRINISYSVGASKNVYCNMLLVVHLITMITPGGPVPSITC